MITGELKNRIDSLWEIFWTGGLTNPLDVIEQITYLMFIRDLDDSDNLRAKESAMLGLPYKSVFADEVTIGERKIEGSQLKWSVFHDYPAARMYSVMQEWVFPFIKNLHGDKNSAYSKYMDDAIFKLPTPLMLSKVVDALDELYKLMNETQSADVRGDVYEYLLAKIATAGVNGQFRTPRHVIKMMVELMEPKADDVIADPACGTSGFLVAAGEFLKERRKEEIFFDRIKKDHFMNHMFHGYDMDRTMLRIGAMNMMTHGIDNPFIEYRDSLSDQNPDKDKYSLILANPPFKGSLDADAVSADLLKICKTKKTELLFIALFLRMLRVGGRCACIVPDGVLFGSSTAHKDIRRALIEENRLEAVISMPSGVFKPYAGVSTGILIFTKTNHGGTDKVWFYDMRADGYSLDDKRSPVDANDIPDIIARFRNLAAEEDRERTEQSFLVPKEEIVGNDYDLSINKYKKTEYKPVEYPPTSEILKVIDRLNEDTAKETRKLHALIEEENDEVLTEEQTVFYCQEMYRVASAYVEFAEAAMKNPPSMSSLSIGYITPAGVNYSFACEVFLKALLLLKCRDFKKMKKDYKSHGLWELYKELPEEWQEWIRLSLEQRRLWRSDLLFRNNMGVENLELDSEAFKKWRYYYEDFWGKHASFSFNLAFISYFAIVLKEACLKLFYDKTPQ